MPGYLRKYSSMAKGVLEKVVRIIDTFSAFAVGIHAKYMFVSLPSKTALRLRLVEAGPSFLTSFTCKGAYRKLEDLHENTWQGRAFEQPLKKVSLAFVHGRKTRFSSVTKVETFSTSILAPV